MNQITTRPWKKEMIFGVQKTEIRNALAVFKTSQENCAFAPLREILLHLLWAKLLG